MITLYQFTNFKKPDASQFCAKVELFSKIAKLDYEVKIGDSRQAPKKKLPYIEDGKKSVCDSEHIIEYLSKKHEVDLDSHLSKEDKAISYGIRKMIDEHLYFILMYSRWIDPKGWDIVGKLFFSSMPLPLRLFVPSLIKKSVVKALYAQGTGRHSEKEVYEFGRKGIGALSDFLGDKKYFMGDKISLLDISAFSFLYAVIEVPKTTDLHKFCMGYKNIVDYVERIFKEFY